MPTSTAYEIVEGLKQAPLGSIAGEEGYRAPFNSGNKSGEVVVVRVRNHSATIERRCPKNLVSFYRGGGKRAAEKDAREGAMSADILQREALIRDVSSYEEKIARVAIALKFDGQRWIIPPAQAQNESPVAVVVPSGVWDLYCGNYERMHSTDPKVRSGEIERMQYRWGTTVPACVMVFKDAIDPETHERTRNHDSEANPYGFLEFTREVVKPSVIAYDADELRAEQIVEV